MDNQTDGDELQAFVKELQTREQVVAKFPTTETGHSDLKTNLGPPYEGEDDDAGDNPTGVVPPTD